MGVHFHHTSFTVSDIVAAEKFIVDLFGMKRIGGGTYDFEYIRTVTGYKEAVLEISFLSFPDSGENLELIEYVKPKGEPVSTATCRPGAAHLSFKVEDIEGDYKRLSEHGVRFKAPPVEITFGINKGSKAVYFNGPDGIALELIQPADPGNGPTDSEGEGPDF